MPPRARAKPAHQQTPWASGKRRPPPRKQPWAKRVQKGFAKALRKYPLLGLVLQIGFAVLAVVLLVTGLLLENVLFFLATTLSALGGVATRRAVFLEQERQMRSGGPKVAPASSGTRRPSPKPTGPAPPPPADGVVLCTESKKPTKDCDCATRHITTAAKSRQFGRPVGTPYGRRNKPGKSNTDKAG
jgi:hypothetical protein